MLTGCRFVAPPCWKGTNSRVLPSLIAGHKIIFSCALHQPRLMEEEQPARSAQERSKSARKTPRCCRLPISHATLLIPSPKIADHKIISLCSPPAKTDGRRAAYKERSRMQQISAQDATMLPPPHSHATLELPQRYTNRTDL